MSSRSFSFQANVDDGTCLPVNTNLTFGGVYQTCHQVGTSSKDMCSSLRQLNPITGDYSCPVGYERVLIQNESKTSTEIRNECNRCWLFFHCCHDKRYDATAIYTAYWCAAKHTVQQNSGFLFGGLYTKTVNNRVTGTYGCPRNFIPLHILDSLFVCVCDDYELGTPNALPFAGFFSCKSGNPLVLNENAKHVKTHLSLFMMQSGPSSYPKSCPDGYSQHIAENDRGCEVYYCLKTAALSTQGLPAVHLPPFMTKPNDDLKTQPIVVFSEDGAVWEKTEDAENLHSDKTVTSDAAASAPLKDDTGRSLSSGAAVVIGIVCTLVVVLMILGVRTYVLWRKRSSQSYESC